METQRLRSFAGIELTDEQLEALAGGTAFTAGTYDFNHGLWGKVTG